jgi:hypothetical protein
MSAGRTFLGALERRSLVAALGLGVAAAVCAFFAAPWLPSAYRLAVFTCLAPSVGSLVLVLIHRVTGGQWTAGLAPFLRAGVALLPWIWLLALPVLLMPQPPASGADHLAASFSYAGLPMTLLRAAIGAVVFFVLRTWLADGVGREAAPTGNRRAWVGPVGLIVVFFLMTFLGDDWLESLEAGWHSTAFPVTWVASQVVSGLALALFCGLRCGARPEKDGLAGRTLGIDWGNLMLATMMFWTYVTFAQFLIIWSGNLPEEISWYVRRETGPWFYFAPAVAVLGFALPFLLLLARRVKRSIPGLSFVAVLLLGSQWIYLVWVIAPAQGLPGIPAVLLLVTAAGAAAALFLNCFARLVRRGGEIA